MNTFTGSLQKRGRRYYLVLSAQGKQKWIALKTGDLRLARRRAAQVAPPDAADETAWLAQLVRLGDAARRRLAQERARVSVPWRRLWTAFCARSPAPIPAASAPAYRRWLDILADAAPPRNAPDALTADDARGVVTALAARYVSAPRLVVFYRRVWRVLGWDAAVWPSGHAFARVATADGAAGANGAAAAASEFYRRLETDEVRRVVRYLDATTAVALKRDPPVAAAGRGVFDAPSSAVALKRDPPVAAAFADMVRIGFCTGLRLSDVAELSRDEVVADGAFLALQPNKTRHSKRQLLRIPLVGEARECVRRRVAAAEAAGETFLFPAAARRRPTAGIARAFRACGVLKRGNGRASFHSLRATFISLMDEAGVPPHVTDAITGHAGGGMHARYTQPSDAALAAAVARAIPAL